MQEETQQPAKQTQQRLDLIRMTGRGFYNRAGNLAIVTSI
jgi:hypothetical protein